MTCSSPAKHVCDVCAHKQVWSESEYRGSDGNRAWLHERHVGVCLTQIGSTSQDKLTLLQTEKVVIEKKKKKSLLYISVIRFLVWSKNSGPSYMIDGVWCQGIWVMSNPFKLIKRCIIWVQSPARGAKWLWLVFKMTQRKQAVYLHWILQVGAPNGFLLRKQLVLHLSVYYYIYFRS